MHGRHNVHFVPPQCAAILGLYTPGLDSSKLNARAGFNDCCGKGFEFSTKSPCLS